MEQILALVAGVGVIGLICWWFFAKQKTGETLATIQDNQQTVEVVVSGGYTPNTVVLRQGVPGSIVFKRTNPSGCFEEVVFPDFGIREHLPVGEAFPITIDTTNAGEYQYACGMNMFFGKVIIRK